MERNNLKAFTEAHLGKQVIAEVGSIFRKGIVAGYDNSHNAIIVGFNNGMGWKDMGNYDAIQLKCDRYWYFNIEDLTVLNP